MIRRVQEALGAAHPAVVATIEVTPRSDVARAVRRLGIVGP
jgi:hypothetical protein